MSGTKHLPEYVHEHIIQIDDTWGAAKDFRRKAKLNHETFKRLVEKGYAKTVIVQRVIAAVDAEKSPTEITGEKIVLIIRKYRDEIMNILSSGVAKEVVPNQLAAWLMSEQDIKRKEICSMLGYGSLSNVNHARQSIRNEMDINRDFENLVYRIEAELEGIQ